MAKPSAQGIDIINDLNEGELDEIKASVSERMRLHERNGRHRSRNNFRNLGDLVVSVEFKVKGVLTETSAVSMTPVSERVIGGESPVYEGGYVVRSQLSVESYNEKIPVNTLIFNGHMNIRYGDSISAKILRCKQVDDGVFPYKVSYLDRRFRKTENAIELCRLNHSRQHVLEIYRSVEYEQVFTK